jgi:hypothetical protein
MENLREKGIIIAPQHAYRILYMVIVYYTLDKLHEMFSKDPLRSGIILKFLINEGYVML